jgi:hypothetical protein
MSDDKPTAKEKARAAKKLKGIFESELPGYPGSFTMPHPFLDRHMRTWWDNAFILRKEQELEATDYDYAECEWKAYVALITKHGSWDIEAVKVGDLDSDGMPMVVKVWAIQEASTYVGFFIPPNRLRGMFGSP